MYKLLIGIPTYGKPDSLFAIDSLGSLLYHIGRRHPEIEDVWIQRDVRTYRQEARQAIVKAAQENKATHLLMLDDDQTFDPDCFDKLWSGMIAGKEEPKMLSGLYFTRGPWTAPCIFKLTKEGTAPYFYYDHDAIMEVDVVGFGFVLFDMTLFERINPPWFNLAIGFGEDAAFCARMIQAGIQPMVHTGCKVGHIMETPKVVTEEVYLEQRAIMERSVESGGQLGSGTPSEQARLEPPGGEANRRTGYQVETRSWWRPPSSRTWKRDSHIGTIERKFGTFEGDKGADISNEGIPGIHGTNENKEGAEEAGTESKTPESG